MSIINTDDIIVYSKLGLKKVEKDVKIFNALKI